MRLRSVVVVCIGLLGLDPASAASLGTAFTYQGKLASGGNPATGLYDLKFTLYDAVTVGSVQGAPFTTNAVVVSNGLFTVTLDFGPSVFNGDARWLDIAVKTNGASGFTSLTPRQPLTPTPYALYAPNAALAATASLAVVANSLGSSALLATNIANGQVVKSLNGLKDAVTLAAGANVTLATNGNTLQISAAGDGGGSATAWSLTGNSNTVGGVNFLGTTDNQPLELKAGGQRALRLEPGAAPNLLGGAVNNQVAGGIVGASISGGAWNSAWANYGVIGGGWSNSVSGFLFGRATVAGGENNRATGDWSAVGGGQFNTAGGPLWGRAVIAGGWENTATGDMAAIGGGSQNSAVIGHAVIGGGQYNLVSNGAWSAIGGGYSNRVLGTAATIPGGAYNEATEAATFAAGRRAKAYHAGSFVWADNSSDNNFASSTECQFAVRAMGGALFWTPEVRLWDALGGSWGWGASLRFGDSDNAYLREEADDHMRLHARLGIRLTGGNVGIGTDAPAAERLDVAGGNILVRGLGGFDATGEEATVWLGDANHYIKGVFGFGVKIGTWPVGDALCMTEQGGGNVGIGTNQPQTKLHVVGTTRTSVLQITGGSDLAEPFETSDSELAPPGTVMVIDDQTPGRLRRSDRAYDQRVAGVISGAGGLNPGLTLSQKGRTDQGASVALSGRVYALADATAGAIRPGDLLTTSEAPGHAMRVTDHHKAQGAVLGKAMSPLDSGRGLVLVLVTLQ